MAQHISDNQYIAVIGDIRDSQKITNRKENRENFRFVLEMINRKYRADISSDFMLTHDNRFQGLILNKQVVFDIIFEIELAMVPIEFRFGIGVGDIHTPIERKNTVKMDGSAYRRAGQTINTIEENEKKYNQGETSVMISMGEDDKQAENLLNAILSLGAALKSKWTSRQKEVIYTYLMSGDNQYKAADILKIGQSSVNKALNTTKYYTFKMALINASHFLGQLETKPH